MPPRRGWINWNDNHLCTCIAPKIASTDRPTQITTNYHCNASRNVLILETFCCNKENTNGLDIIAANYNYQNLNSYFNCNAYDNFKIKLPDQNVNIKKRMNILIQLVLLVY